LPTDWRLTVGCAEAEEEADALSVCAGARCAQTTLIINAKTQIVENRAQILEINLLVRKMKISWCGGN
jgi:hypothetical protein